MTDLTMIFKDMKVLILDDKNTAHMSVKLRALFPGVEPVTVSTVRSAKQFLERQYWDLVVLDLNMEEDTELPEDERPSGGFYVYFHLLKVESEAPKNVLPALVVMFTGNEGLQTWLGPFFPIKKKEQLQAKRLDEILEEELQRKKPFSVVIKEGTTEELRNQLICLETARFMNNYKWLGSGHEVLPMLDLMARIAVPAEMRSALSEIEMARGLPLKRVLPTLVGLVIDGQQGFPPLLSQVLASQNWLAKLNYLFQKSQPGGRFLHSELSQWSDFVEQLSILPDDLVEQIYADMEINPPAKGRGSDTPSFINRAADGDVSKSNDKLEVADYGEWLREVGQHFKAKWSRWNEEIQRGITDESVTLIGTVFEAVKGVCADSNRDVTPQLQFIGSGGGIKRLYLRPDLPIRIAKEATLNSITNNSAVSKIIVRVVQDQETNAICLDIIDDGAGFDPEVVPWENAFSGWQRDLLGWGGLEIYTRQDEVVWLMKEGRTAPSEFPNVSAAEGSEFGVLVRLRFTYRHDWDYGI